MSPEQMRLLSTLLDQAMDLRGEEREAWFATLQGEAAEVAPLLRQMLSKPADTSADRQWSRGPEFTALGEAASPLEFAAGHTVGAYRLVQPLGRGGMGEVWIAERSDGVMKRSVALKLPFLGLRGGGVLAQRFAREREILARLAHPHIARLYDAGVAESGQPYLALEFVAGRHITDFCREEGLDIAAKVRLVQQVIEAVQYAHANLVVHRDIKPSNVVVDASGQAMLLDFGIAKMLEEVDTDVAETELTRLGGRALTLSYAAPEQVAGEPVSTATDVWSLGVLLYEVLTGNRPFQGDRKQLEQAIATRDAPKAAGVPADLATIVAKAMKRLPAERYATANAMAADLDRWLNGLPVLAQPDSTWYRTRKFVHRHRVGSAVTVAVTAAIVAATAAALWQAGVARHQARIAVQEARTAQAVQDFLEGVFMTSSGDQSEPLKARERSARDLLDEGAARVDRALADAPQAQLRVLKLLARIYEDLGDMDRLEALQRKRLALVERSEPTPGEEHVVALADLAGVLGINGKYPEALERLTRADALLKTLPAASDHTHVAVDLALADYFGERADVRGLEPAKRAAERLGRQAPSMELMGALMLRGKFEKLALRTDDAVRTLREAVATADKLPAGGENGLGAALLELSTAESAAGLRSAAEADMRRAIAVADRNAGPNSPMAIVLRGRLGQLLCEHGRPAEALEVLAEARRRLGASPFTPQQARIGVPPLVFEGRSLHRRGDLAGALERFEQASAFARRPDGEPISTLFAAIGQASVLTDMGRFAAAEEALGEARRVRDQAQLHAFQQSNAFAQAEVRLAIARARADEAAAAYGSFEALPEVQGHREAASVLALHAEVALAHDGAASAVPGTTEALRLLRSRAPEPDSDYDQQRLRLVLARSLDATGRHDEAAAVLTELLEQDRVLSDPALSPLRVAALRELAAASPRAAGDRSAEAEADAIVARHRSLGSQWTGGKR